MRSIDEIINDAGGPAAIASASNKALTESTPKKWKRNGIPDWHWPILKELANATTEELYQANIAVRKKRLEKSDAHF